ncbi:MAG: amidohydrolase family protein [Candidatus Bathyarchaeota archaeon]|nr:MAG: amidohydrolase family protein [Candidatus Bathyarchaeota archaeon]
MDPGRRVLEDGAVAVDGGQILEVGSSAELGSKHSASRTIDASGKIVMPGLLDGHSHAGHGLIKSLGMHNDLWYQACDRVYAEGSTEEFWEAEALLTAVERLRFGVTCSLTFFGGGDSVMRTDDTAYGDRHCGAVEKVGVREYLAVGPRRPPFPRRYSRWDGWERSDHEVSFEDQLSVSEALIRRWNREDGRVNVCMMLPTSHPERTPITGSELEDVKYMAQAARELSKRYGVLFTQDGHTGGTVKFAHNELDLLGPDALLSHSTDLTDEEIGLLMRTDTRVVHNPSAVASMTARCPVPELLDVGVTVMLGSDASAPDRSFDMFRHMFQCMRYHRRHYRDPRVMPPGKVLEMATVDAAKAMGLDRELGSLEPGKRADIILVDARRPHMYPMNMAVDRVAYYANGNDVATVLVDGDVLMEDGVVKTVDEGEVLEMAQREAEAAIDRNDLRHLLDYTEGYWGRSRY